MTIGDTSIISRILTFSKTGIVTASYSEDSVSKGYGFQIQKRITLTTEQTYYLVLDSTALIALKKRLFILPLLMLTGGGMVFVDTYAIEGYTGGTEVTPLKINGNSDLTPDCIFKKGITPTGDPLTDTREYIVGTLSTNQASGGGSIPPDIAKQFPAGSIIVVKLMNQEAATVYLDFGLIFFEFPTGEI